MERFDGESTTTWNVRDGASLGLLSRGGGWRRKGPGEGEGGAATGDALRLDGAAMILNDPLDDGEAQAGSVALAGEEGPEDVIQVLGRDPEPVVGHLNPLATLGLETPEEEPAPSIQCLESVRGQVQDHLFHEGLVKMARLFVGGGFENDPDLAGEPDVMAQQGQRLSQQLAHSVRSQGRCSSSGVGKKLGEFGLESNRLLSEKGEDEMSFGPFRFILLEDLDTGEQRSEGCPYLVGQTRGDLAQKGQTLLTSQMSRLFGDPLLEGLRIFKEPGLQAFLLAHIPEDVESRGSPVGAGKRGDEHVVRAPGNQRTPLQTLGRAEGAHAGVATQTVGCTKTEELVTPFPHPLPELVPQLLVHELDAERAVGNEDAIREIFEDAPQGIPFMPYLLTSFFPFSYHRGERSSNVGGDPVYSGL
jgi:hypothetical protein